MNLRIISLFVLITAIIITSSLSADLLSNPGLENDIGNNNIPDNWSFYSTQLGGGSHSTLYAENDPANANTGQDSAMLTATNNAYAMIIQQVSPATPGTEYTITGWIKDAMPSGSPSASAPKFKLEFYNSSGSAIIKQEIPVPAVGSTYEFRTASYTAPTGTVWMKAIAVVTQWSPGTSSYYYDDFTLTSQSGPGPGTNVFDLNETSGVFTGFGAQIWGYGDTPAYPNLEQYRQMALTELNIKYVRIENHNESASWPAMQRTRAMTDSLGIDWVYMTWIAWCCTDAGGMLNNVSAFSSWWVSHVADLYAHGIPIEYIEEMNEPDSWGAWSTGISYTNFNLLMIQMRADLDAAGLTGVGLIGPGPASIWEFPNYANAMTAPGNASIAGWSTHAWGSDGAWSGDGGAGAGQYTQDTFVNNFIVHADNQNPSIPKFVTEYSTHERTFHGVTYPNGDSYGTWDPGKTFPYYSVTNSMPYAARVYENTLGILNSGAQAPFIWQANDEPTETITGSKRKAWGLIDLWGQPKPVYLALKTLYPKIPVGAQVVTPPNQSASPLYKGIYKDGTRIVVGVANDTPSLQTGTVELINAPANLQVYEALACEIVTWGNVATGTPDQAQIVNRNITLIPAAAGEYSFDVTLPRDSTLTIVLDVGIADLNANGTVDTDDLRILAGELGQTPVLADIAPSQGDGAVNIKDLAMMSRFWDGL